MEVKKSPKADLQNQRRTFLLIGLIVALGSMIGLFSWSQSEKVIDVVQNNGDIIEQDIMDVTLVDEKKPEPVKVETTVSDILNIVKNDTKIDQKITFIDDIDLDKLGDISVKSFQSTKEQTLEEDIPVLKADEMPTFQGKDLNAFRAWCMENLVYPSVAADNGVQGRVSLSFVVERDGSVSNVKIVRGADPDLDAAALKVIAKSPKWSPGKNRGKPIRFSYNMPVDFVLTN